MPAARIALGAIVLAGCEASLSPVPGPVVDHTPPVTLTLRVGEAAMVAGLEVQVGGVPHDSRCPVDVLCPVMGNAVVEVIVSPGAGLGPAYLLTLNTSEEPFAGEALGLRVALLELRPAPISTRVIRPEDYTVELLITLVTAL